MNDDKRSYPGQNREHKFGVKGRKKGKRTDLTLVWDADRDNQTENVETTKTSKKKCKAKWVVIVFFFVIGLTEVLCEHYIIPKGLHHVILNANIIYEIFILIAGLLFNWDKLKYMSKYDEPWIEELVNALKQAWDVLKRAIILQSLLLIGVGVLIGARMAKVEVTNKVLRSCKAVVYVLKNEDAEVLSYPGIRSPEIKNVILMKDEEMVKKAKELSVSGDEQSMERNLSQDDYNYVYFMGGEYDISKLKKQNDVNDMIKDFVSDQQEKQRDNIFDKPDKEGGAPTEVEKVISDASEREEKAEKLKDIEEILGDREDAYKEYPKATLAKLISNGYEWMALILMVHGGTVESINYYYGQSILKDFEYLQFAGISDVNIKSRLLKVSQKYEDIMAINSGWEEKFPTAMKLRDAFQEAADQY